MESILDLAALTTEEKSGAEPIWPSWATFTVASADYPDLSRLYELSTIAQLETWLYPERTSWQRHFTAPDSANYQPAEVLRLYRALVSRLATLSATIPPDTHQIAVRWGDPRLAAVLECWRRALVTTPDPHPLATESIEALRIIRKLGFDPDLLVTAEVLVGEVLTTERGIDRLGWLATERYTSTAFDYAGDRELMELGRSSLRATRHMLAGFYALHGRRVTVVAEGMALKLHVIPKILGIQGVASDDPDENPHGWREWSPYEAYYPEPMVLSWAALPPRAPDVLDLIYDMPGLQFYQVGDYYLARHMGRRWEVSGADAR